jgi:hypothetical protein
MLPKSNANDFFMEAVKGNIYGITAVKLQGRNPDNDIATEDVWIGSSIAFGDGTPTARTLRASAAQVYVSSSANHATDRSRSVTITGLDGNYDEISETIHLNASNSQTRVASTKTYLRINTAVLDGACTGTVFVGTGAVTSGVPDEKAKVDAVIAIGSLFAEQAFYTIPRNKKGYIYNVAINTTGAATTLSAELTVTTSGSVSTVYKISNQFTSPGSVGRSFPVPIEVDAESDIVLTVTSDSANIVVTADIDIVLENIIVEASTVDLMNFGAWQSYMSGKTISSAYLYLIGLSAIPVTVPTEVVWNVVAGPITGQTSTNTALNPVYDTDIAFSASKFAGGAHDIVASIGDYEGAVAVWKVTDSTTAVKYVLAPVNTIINFTRVSNVKFNAL